MLNFIMTVNFNITVFIIAQSKGKNLFTVAIYIFRRLKLKKVRFFLKYFVLIQPRCSIKFYIDTILCVYLVFFSVSDWEEFEPFESLFFYHRNRHICHNIKNGVGGRVKYQAIKYSMLNFPADNWLINILEIALLRSRC